MFSNDLDYYDLPFDSNAHTIIHPQGCFGDNITDYDLDDICDVYDEDDDNDGIFDLDDQCPQGIINDGSDLDNDGCQDEEDQCPLDVDNDADNDGVCGDVDQCEGHDDNIDSDTDGVADGCDLCPYDFNDDSDGDGSCDGVDLCEGNDNTGDSDSDGICDDQELSPHLELSQNYPNPFNPISKINYSIPKSGIISLHLVDINGRLIKKLISNKYHFEDKYTYEINGQNLNSGIYIVQLISQDDMVSRKIAVIK